MGYLFDTNAAIALHRLDSSLDRVIRQAEKDKENIFFSVICYNSVRVYSRVAH
ncbi:putative nucleic acid-binding protein [Paenibacillus polymyxa]|nr:putative nucleic acid-binding protein [Paenibacillus polymyxa]